MAWNDVESRFKMKYKDITGFKFGRLTVVEIASTRKNAKKIDWVCECDCGNKTIATGTELRIGNVRSCGCLSSDLSRERATKHGACATKEYHAYRSMKDRCYRVSHEYYSKYGAKGVSVCSEWLESFDNFLNDMGKAPSKEHSLDRIDNDGNYEPSNCRWATKQEQSVNRSNTVWIEFNGEMKHLAEWSRVLGVSSITLQNRIKKYGVDKAMTMKPTKKDSK